MNYDIVVLLPIVFDENQVPSVVFEVRSANVSQPLEICLPGGKMEEGETPLQGVKRETCEELCIKEKDIQNIEKICSFQNGERMVHFFTAILSNYDNTYAKEEVDSIFQISEKEILEKEMEEFSLKYQAMETDGFPYERIPHGRAYPFHVLFHSTYFLESNHGWIWGFTARLILEYRKWKKIH